MPGSTTENVPDTADIIQAGFGILDALALEAGLGAELRSVVESYRDTGERVRVPPFCTIPALTFAAVTGDFEAARPLCGVAFLLYLGIDLLDDLMDGDETPYWRGQPAAETLLLASTLVSAVPQAAIGGLGASAGTATALQNALARGLLDMAEGQRGDLAASRGGFVTPTEVEASVAGKSGGMTALLAELGAILGQAPAATVREYGSWGRGYGTAEQIRSDCADLFRETSPADLRNGTMTYPLACLVEATAEGERAARLQRLRQASVDPVELQAVRALLMSSGALAAAAMAAEWRLSGARAALERAEPREPAATMLRELTAQPRLKTGLLPGRE